MPAVAGNERRVLTLLRLLNDDARTSVFASLPDEIRTELQNRIRTEAGRFPSQKRIEELIDEFQRLFRLAEKIRGPQLKMHTPDEEDSEVEEEIYLLSGKSNRDLEKMNLFQLAAVLDEESPRTVALLLQNLSSPRVADLLKQISPQQRQAVVLELARNPQAPEIVFEKIAATTIQRATSYPKQKKELVDPILRMADVFREIDKNDRRELIDSLREQNEEVAMELQKAMYRFEDIIDLQDRQVQEVLAQIDSNTLQEALFEADSALVEKIMSNLSRRAASTLREELAYQRPLSPMQQKAARDKVAQAIGAVDEESA
ncbi:FliG C-terminal domain-containing protein [Thalassoglobus sp.]|uniref:FliG C-terminal domain-containing protein n=1 Tax=Thalassoglobus sp. TaxID=2795869 RepID=UPI003AA9A23B